MADFRWLGYGNNFKARLRSWLFGWRLTQLFSIVIALMALQSTNAAFALSAPGDCAQYGGSLYCVKSTVKYNQQVGPGDVYDDGDSACLALYSTRPEGTTSGHFWPYYPGLGPGCGYTWINPRTHASGFTFAQNWVLATQSCPVIPGSVVVSGWLDTDDTSPVYWGRQWCAYGSLPIIGLTANPGRTNALPAGPVVPVVASVTQNGSPLANRAVSISIAGGTSLSGHTNSAGKFAFNYVPPSNPTTANLSATCTGCVNTAQTSITVDAPPPTCSAADFASEAGSLVGNPISPATGSKFQTENDFADNAPHGLSVTRQYRSTAGLPAAGFGTGNAWSHNYMASLVLSNDGKQATVALGDGSIVSFTRETQNYPWVPSVGNPNHQLAEINPLQYNDAGAQVYTSDADDTRYRFAITGGKAQAILQRNGWRMNLAYLLTGQLASATNAFGRSLGFAYNASGQLSVLTQPDGQTLAYSYDGAAKLTQVAYPGGGTRTYVYENTTFPLALTGIVDENNLRLATFAYDALGRATSSSHAGGAQNTSINYPVTDAASTVLPQGGLVAASSALDPALFQRTVQITDALGNPYSVSYQGGDGFVRVLGSTTPVGGSTFALRTMEGSLPSSETDFLGITTFYSWDASRRLQTSTTRATGRPEEQSSTTQWHAGFRLPVLITEPGKTTELAYDELGNKLIQTETDTTSGPSNGQTRTWAWAYTPQGLPSSMTDPLGRTSTYSYDSAGNLASSTNALGQNTSYLYDGAGRITSSSAPNGLQTTYSHDARGRLAQVVAGANLAAASQQTSLYTYTPSGQLASVQLPSGFKVNYSYDAAQRLVGATDNRGNSIAYTLDGMGNRVNEVVKDPSGAIAYATTRSINALNRVASVQDGGLGTTTLAYDANGEQTGSTDALNQTTSQTLDALRRPKTTTFADGASASQAWNALNQITQATDPKGVATSYTKNAWGEVLQETSPDSGTTSYQRNAVGNVSSKTDARGQTTSYSYDALDRVTQATLADGKVQTFAWDGTGTGAQVGYLRQFTDPSGSTAYERDAFGRITRKTQVAVDSSLAPTTLTTKYAYSNGQLAQITYPSGFKVAYTRNTTGQLQVMSTTPAATLANPAPASAPLLFMTTWSSTFATAYSGLNQPRLWQYANGAAGARGYNQQGVAIGADAGGVAQDAAGRPHFYAQQLHYAPGAVALYPYGGWFLSNDSRNRLAATQFMASSAPDFTYSYDANSNRTAAVQVQDGLLDWMAELAAAQSKTTQHSYSLAANSNRLAGVSKSVVLKQGGSVVSTLNSGVSFNWDAAGNQLGDGLRSFAYDAENRHSKTVISDSDEGSKESYLFNALGQRVFKSDAQVDHTAPSQAALGSDFITWLQSNFAWLFGSSSNSTATLGTHFNYADPSPNAGAASTLPAWALLGEYGNGGNITTAPTEYIWMPTEDNTPILVAFYRGGRLYSVHTDHLGTPRVIRDDSNQVVWQLPFSPFGEIKPSGPLQSVSTTVNGSAQTQIRATQPSITFNLRYPGQYFDSESNLNYNFFRTYNQNTGRYTQFDPIGLAGGPNGYLYAGASPLSRIDPWGLADFPVIFNGGAGTLWVVPPGGTSAEGFPAGNNTTLASRGAWAPGTYTYGYSTTHKDDAPGSSYGSNGNAVFKVPGCVGCGVHSGREYKADRRGGSGIQHVTEGCIRTTDDATKLIQDLIRQGHRPVLEVTR